MGKKPETENMAVFCDFENVALGVRDARHAQFDILKVLEKLLLKGSIVVKKAYCDWERYKDFKAAMHEAAFELIEIPHVRQSGKNSADIRMVVDALDLCYTKLHVDTFVVKSCSAASLSRSRSRAALLTLGLADVGCRPGHDGSLPEGTGPLRSSPRQASASSRARHREDEAGYWFREDNAPIPASERQSRSLLRPGASGPHCEGTTSGSYYFGRPGDRMRLHGPCRRGDRFLRDSEATRSTHEIRGSVPERPPVGSARTSASTPATAPSQLALGARRARVPR